MKRAAFFQTIDGCLALIEICAPSTARAVSYSVANETIHALFPNGHRVRYHLATETCHGDFKSPFKNPENGAPFEEQANLPLSDATALRAFLLVHLCPALALMDILKHHCGETTSLRCALDANGAYRFECPLTERSLSVDVDMVAKHMQPHRMVHTGARFDTDDRAPTRPEQMLEHSGFMPLPPDFDPRTLQMSPELKRLQTEVLGHLLAVEK